MDLANPATVDDVTSVVALVLGIEDRAATLDASTQLLGGLPEFDSMAVVELAAALETRFGISIDDDEITDATFDTLGSLASYVDSKRDQRD